MKMLYSFLTVLLLSMGLQGVVFADNHGEPPVEELSAEFQELILQETDENNRVLAYNSKEELKQAFTEIMSPEVADYYIELFFSEDSGYAEAQEEEGLYLVPMDGPLYLKTDEDYQLERIDDEHYKLTQHSQDAIRGEYTLTIHYQYTGDRWIIADRMDIVGIEEGGELPATASQNPIWMLLGTLLVGVGVISVYRTPSRSVQ